LGETNATFFNPPALILAGTYSYDCVVTDGCSSFTTSPKVITIVPDPSVGISGNASVCLNTSTTLTANITDGTGLYAYQWRSGTTATGPWTDISGEINSTYNPPTTSVGTFYFQVFVHPNHPECNQTTSATHTLVVNAPPVAATASTTVQPTCAVATGTIVVTAPLGAYQYNIDGGAWQASVTFAGVAAGLHNILVRSTADNTCVSAPTAVTVNAQPLPPAAPTGSATVQPTCALATGTIVVTAPVGAYQYNIDGGAWQASVTFAGVTAGSHNILVRSTADNTCVSAPTAVTVNAQPSPPAALTASTTVQPTCALATGTIVVTAPVGAYQYNIDGGAWQASVTFAGVAAGSHNILVRSTADNTCVSAPTAVTVNAVPPVPSCNITGTSSVFSGSSDTYTSTPVPADNVTHSWSISGNGTITSVTTNATVDVTAGSAGTFTLTDNIIRFGCTSSCTFDVTVISPCSISPISGSVTNGTTTTYSAPAGMDTYSWTITGNGSIPSGIANQQAVAVLAGNLCTSYTLSLSMTKNGVTSTCSQTVTVTDNQAPTFTLPTTELSYCVNNIISAVYNPTPTPLIIPEYDDITTPRPEYYLLTSTGKFLDLDPIINSFDDNCCADNSLKIHWRIVFAPTPNPATVAHELITKPAITGQTGQPSAYGDILFPGDGVTFTDVVHRIYYWLEDCNGNPKGIPNEQFVNITIKPRPNIMKVP